MTYNQLKLIIEQMDKKELEDSVDIGLPCKHGAGETYFYQCNSLTYDKILNKYILTGLEYE
mgnify:FL=1|jgi:hypothetical protein|tara:strand:- start:1334 stop:1516 length:183 start_codon:yes stop_codon:yes gene_type:complete